MAIKATKKEIMDSWFCVSVPYEDAHHLLKFAHEIAFTHDKMAGWGASVYFVDGVCVVTGYRPFGTVKATPELLEKYEQRAREACKACHNSELINELLRAWVGEERSAYIEKKYPRKSARKEGANV